VVRHEQITCKCIQIVVLSTRHNVRDINITINDDSINVENDVKYIGVYVANDLSWDKHVSNERRNIRQTFGV